MLKTRKNNLSVKMCLPLVSFGYFVHFELSSPIHAYHCYCPSSIRYINLSCFVSHCKRKRGKLSTNKYLISSVSWLLDNRDLKVYNIMKILLSQWVNEFSFSFQYGLIIYLFIIRLFRFCTKLFEAKKFNQSLKICSKYERIKYVLILGMFNWTQFKTFYEIISPSRHKYFVPL